MSFFSTIGRLHYYLLCIYSSRRRLMRALVDEQLSPTACSHILRLRFVRLELNEGKMAFFFSSSSLLSLSYRYYTSINPHLPQLLPRTIVSYHTISINSGIYRGIQSFLRSGSLYISSSFRRSSIFSGPQLFPSPRLSFSLSLVAAFKGNYCFVL